MLMLVLVILLIFAIVGLPQVGGAWHSFGYAPSGIVIVLVVIVCVLLLTGRL